MRRGLGSAFALPVLLSGSSRAEMFALSMMLGVALLISRISAKMPRVANFAAIWFVLSVELGNVVFCA